MRLQTKFMGLQMKNEKQLKCESYEFWAVIPIMRQ